MIKYENLVISVFTIPEVLVQSSKGMCCLPIDSHEIEILRQFEYHINKDAEPILKRIAEKFNFILENSEIPF